MSTLAQTVVVKLGVNKKDETDILFRRVNLSQHEKYNEDLYYVLKLYSIQTFTGGDVLPQSATGYRVNFIYCDMDGDKVMIGSSEELADALKMHKTKGLIKIIAGVEQRDGSEASRSPSMATLTGGSQASEESLQDPKPAPTAVPSSASSFIQDSPPHIQHILESVVAQIASIPAVMHLQVRGTGPARPVPTSAPTTTTAAPTPTLAPVVAPPAVDANQAPAPTEPEPLFIHGRHTCDGCLTTPIIGQRFHAVNLPDYDLCSNCRHNYKGEEIQFEPVELDRDRTFQDRWHRRHMRWGPSHHRHAPPTPHCGPHAHHHDHHGPPHHHWGPHHHHWGPRGPHRRWGRDPSFGPPAPHAGPSPEEVDSALKEAIRRSLSDLRAEEKAQKNIQSVEFRRKKADMLAKLAAKNKAAKEAQEAAKEAEAIKRTKADLPDKCAASLPDARTRMESPTKEETLVDSKPAAAPQENVAALKEDAVDAKPGLMEEVEVKLPMKMPSPPPSPSKMSDTSFEDEAEGNGDIAKLVGSTLDKFAAAIDDFNSEFDRALSTNESDESGVVVVSAEGAEIVKAEDTSDDEMSQGSWVVDDEQFASDEALARAAHAIGSALFQSDMIQSVQSAGNVSTLSHSGNGSSSNSLGGPSLAPSAMSVPTNPGSVTHYQMDRWVVQLNELHGMGLDDDAKIIEILERLSAANLGSDCTDEIAIERVVDEYYK